MENGAIIFGLLLAAFIGFMFGIVQGWKHGYLDAVNDYMKGGDSRVWSARFRVAMCTIKYRREVRELEAEHRTEVKEADEG